MEIILNDFDVPINVHKIPDNIAERISLEGVFGSLGMRVRVYSGDKPLTFLHRIDPKIEKGTAVTVDPSDGKKRRVKYKRLVGGRWQLDIDRRNGCGRLFETKEHAINAALAIGLRRKKKKDNSQ